MNILKTIPAEVAKIIPINQLIVTRQNLSAFADAIEQIQKQLAKCPKLYETEKMEEHPVIFHYFAFTTDIYICEYSPNERQMFGYTILNSDLQNAEWGYISLDEILLSKTLNLDYHFFEEQTIEAILYKAYPKNFKKPKSLIK